MYYYVGQSLEQMRNIPLTLDAPPRSLTIFIPDAAGRHEAELHGDAFKHNS